MDDRQALSQLICTLSPKISLFLLSIDLSLLLGYPGNLMSTLNQRCGLCQVMPRFPCLNTGAINRVSLLLCEGKMNLFMESVEQCLAVSNLISSGCH